MQNPRYVDALLRTKLQRTLCAEHSNFCLPMFSYFRFLTTDYQFRLHEICRHRHELWITFRASLPIPIKRPQYFDTYVDITIETEYYMSTYGHISLFTPNAPYDALRSMGLEHVYKTYRNSHGHEFIETNGNLNLQLKEIKLVADLMRENWDDILLRLTRNIPSSKFGG
jgi:hypothetical protein